MFILGDVAQLVERWFVDPKVMGSNPIILDHLF